VNRAGAILRGRGLRRVERIDFSRCLASTARRFIFKVGVNVHSPAENSSCQHNRFFSFSTAPTFIQPSTTPSYNAARRGCRTSSSRDKNVTWLSCAQSLDKGKQGRIIAAETFRLSDHDGLATRALSLSEASIGWAIKLPARGLDQSFSGPVTDRKPSVSDFQCRRLEESVGESLADSFGMFQYPQNTRARPESRIFRNPHFYIRSGLPTVPADAPSGCSRRNGRGLGQAITLVMRIPAPRTTPQLAAQGSPSGNVNLDLSTMPCESAKTRAVGHTPRPGGGISPARISDRVHHDRKGRTPKCFRFANARVCSGCRDFCR